MALQHRHHLSLRASRRRQQGNDEEDYYGHESALRMVPSSTLLIELTLVSTRCPTPDGEAGGAPGTAMGEEAVAASTAILAKEADSADACRRMGTDGGGLGLDNGHHVRVMCIIIKETRKGVRQHWISNRVWSPSYLGASSSGSSMGGRPTLYYRDQRKT